MKAKVYKYSDPENQIVYFRGYVEYIEDMCLHRVSCDEVHKTRGAALRDAEKLQKKMKSSKV